MKLTPVLAGALLCLAVAAYAAPPLANPVNVPAGGSVHLTPVEQLGAPIPISQCTLLNITATRFSVVKDATGWVIAALLPSGSDIGARVSCTDGVNPAMQSAVFAVTIIPPPYAVTAVGTTSP